MELDEAQLLDALALLQVPMGTLGWLAQKCISSPYGRYVTPGGRCQLPARVSWVLQELPSLVLPLLLLLRAPPGTPTPNLLLLSMFVLHYVQRNKITEGGRETHLQPCFITHDASPLQFLDFPASHPRGEADPRLCVLVGLPVLHLQRLPAGPLPDPPRSVCGGLAHRPPLSRRLSSLALGPDDQPPLGSHPQESPGAGGDRLQDPTRGSL
ncbi:3-oxo-5-alpha-steroid 4-dehydrogenase 1 isoform X5 [Erinaceus europaeus]|uniref:3-oxo-5-alpha-steroid 4-dehydrogenase 1 isoform X5 n=1 Tax=Erinaceus europaeus TaxID=9365 RepID=A0ABM3XE82_ERIEU|nr:3-oxo-5-alpha-steroid 4-dehydrogenase 1 isoform X5 [Erinaceus europaeus]